MRREPPILINQHRERGDDLEKKLQYSFAHEIYNAILLSSIGEIILAEHIGEYDVITAKIGPMEIPQHPFFPVKRVECVSIRVCADGLPTVICRDDFPIVPHLNIRKNGEKDLCLYDLPYEELRYQLNAFTFVERIRYWFEKTARNELHQPKQLLEPFFPFVSDSVILNGIPNGSIAVRLMNISSTKGKKLLKECPIDNAEAGEVYVLLPFRINKIYSQNIINNIPTSLSELDDCFEDDLLSQIDTLIKLVWSVKKDQNRYMRFFHQSENNLNNSKILILVDVGVSRTEGEPAEQHTFRVFECGVKFSSLYRAFGYSKQRGELVKNSELGRVSEIKLFPYNYVPATTRNLLQISNGNNNFECEDSDVQIGIGTLGSQIANNCIREGFGKWTYIDVDDFLPHNIARHVFPLSFVGKNKAFAMRDYCRSLVSDEVSRYTDEPLPTSVFSSQYENEILDSINSSNLVVDTSASIAVERYLCMHLSNGTRCVSFFVNPKGTALVMLLESDDRSVRLDSLEMQYYRMLLRNPKLEDHLVSEEKYDYSTSCRSSSFVISQASISAFAGIATRVIKQIKKTPNGQISIWTENGFSIDYVTEQGESFKKFSCDEWIVLVSPTLETELYQERKRKLPNETGGVLIGTIDYYERKIYVVDQIASPDDSIEYPCAFIRGSSGLKAKMDKIQQITKGNLCYIGEWHSHTSNNTNQSTLDKKLLKTVSEFCIYDGAPGCMIIAGENHISVYLEMITRETARDVQ